MQDEVLMHVRELPDYINIVKFWNTRPHTPPPPFPVINELRFIPLARYKFAQYTSG